MNTSASRFYSIRSRSHRSIDWGSLMLTLCSVCYNHIRSYPCSLIQCMDSSSLVPIRPGWRHVATSHDCPTEYPVTSQRPSCRRHYNYHLPHRLVNEHHRIRLPLPFPPVMQALSPSTDTPLVIVSGHLQPNFENIYTLSTFSHFPHSLSSDSLFCSKRLFSPPWLSPKLRSLFPFPLSFVGQRSTPRTLVSMSSFCLPFLKASHLSASMLIVILFVRVLFIHICSVYHYFSFCPCTPYRILTLLNYMSTSTPSVSFQLIGRRGNWWCFMAMSA